MEAGGQDQWTVPDGVELGRKVAVRAFTYNEQAQRYEFARDDDPFPSLIWTPVADPANPSTTLPSEETYSPSYTGAELTPEEHFEIDGYPGFEDGSFEDYILVFPADSGLPPLYIVFKSPRDLPGTVTGAGAPATADWERLADTPAGARIPSAVADMLRGNDYQNFKNFRGAIWRRMAKLEEITRHMSPANISRMKDGLAPLAPPEKVTGSRIQYELHHEIPISQDGGVYDIDNIVILISYEHINIHRTKKP